MKNAVCISISGSITTQLPEDGAVIGEFLRQFKRFAQVSGD
jgi:hypothetical protein